MKSTNIQNKGLNIIRILFFLGGIISPIVTYTWRTIYPDLNSSLLMSWFFSSVFLLIFLLTYTSNFIQKHILYFAYGIFYLSGLSGLYFAYSNNFDFGYTLLAIIVVFVSTLIYNTPKSLMLYKVSILPIVFIALYLKKDVAIINPVILVMVILIFSMVSFIVIKFKYEAQQELLLSREQIKQMANHDPLTNIPNRKMLEERLTSVLLLSQKNEAKFALLFIDLDDFKLVNDKYGHFIGDEVLVGVADRLKTVIREGDIVGRFGGDEFIILLSSIKEKKNAFEVAERIKELFKDPLKVNEVDIVIPLSIGIGVYPDNGITPKEIMTFADKDMYEKKAQ